MKNLETMLSSKDMTWATPQDFFDNLNLEFKFTLDPCATKETAKCSKYFTKEIDGLSQNWDNEIVFMNPPYGREISKWIKKATEQRGGYVVCLIPARTDTKYFHDFLYKKNNVELRFVKGRLKFEGKQKGSGSAPFPSLIAIIDNRI